MHRRKFISYVGIVSGGALYASNIAKAENNKPVSSSSAAGSVKEPARDIPVIEKTDVLVIGGGPAGVAAAIAASRAGSSTILVERYNHLGGLWTGGLVLPLLSTHGLHKNGEFKKVIYGFGEEVSQKLFDLGMAIHEINPVVDPEAAKYVLEVMIKESGVKMFYHCWASNVIVNNNTIEAVILDSKAGRVAIQAKVVIDTTGDGDIFNLAGEKFDTLNYMIGLVHRLGNVDRIDKNKPGYKEMKIGEPTPIPSVNWVNMGGEKDVDGTDIYTLSKLQQKHRISIWESVQEIRATPGYEEVFLLETAPQLGVRMSRILQGQYMLTFEDTMTYKTFDDVIGISGAWIPVNYKGKRVPFKERPFWQIPYRSLVPKNINNLLVAGRCFSYEKLVFEDARIIGTCMVTGQGAGAAASLCAMSNSSVRDADISKIQKILKEQKANLG